MKFLLYSFLMMTFFSCQKAPHECQETIVEKTDTVFIEKNDSISLEETPPIPDYYWESILPYVTNADGEIGPITIDKKYTLNTEMNPLYFEGYFDNDSLIDVAIAIKDTATNKSGILIQHGNTGEQFILGANNPFVMWENEKPQTDFYWWNLWYVNRYEVNYPGVDNPDTLILENDCISIEKLEVGGGLIYWDGKKYAYFHQTC